MQHDAPTLPPPPGQFPPPPPAYHQLAPQQAQHSFQPPKGYKLKKRRRWPWVVLAILVIGGIASAAAKPKTDDSTGTPAPAPVAADQSGGALVVGSTGTTSGFAVTLLSATDPWVSTNQFEQPAAGNRYVAVELNMVNTTSESQTFSTLLGLELIDSSAQHWTPVFAGASLPQLGGDLAPGEAIRGSQVFEVPVASTGLRLSVKGSLSASGIDFTL